MAKSVSRQPKSGSQVIMSDRISELPDSLLQHILSFLPTKQAIATSLLSKRWRPLWRGLSTLYVDDLGFQGFQSFAQFVAAVLIVGDLKPLEKFRIFCRQNYSSQGSIIANWTKIWIYAAINRKVEQLELFFPFTFKGISLPPSIFICSTIQRLSLSWVTVDALSHVNLPSLKLMSVCKIRFPDFKCAAMLLSGCPRLEKLALLDVHIHNCNISTALDVGSLQHLASAVFPAFLMTLKAFSGVKILRLCQNIWSPSQDMPTYHNLTFMEFSCYAKDWGSIVRCLKNCPKLQIIRILQALVHGENNWIEPIVVDVPLCISSQLKTFYLAGYQDWNSQFQMVRFILKEAKVLRTISIRSICSASLENKHQMLNRLSKCPRSSENCKLLFD